ncbi:baseplate J/gp47 family protein [Pontibacter pamirensis]|uniref:hypothetical protein n=1 Tax=Pontibacter pamirensis TaxID=2562824 RepID=UPI001389863E|nr:hypothetical protein [Pontibacter pamirensis]
MDDCKNLIHPFQTDPGVSQRQRIMDELLSGPAIIDGRTLADLLDYFVQLSRHVNYYDADLSVSDWQPFFQKSLPFSLAAMSKYKQVAVTEKLSIYQDLFRKHAAPSGLQLLTHYVFYSTVYNINIWHLQVKGSELPVAFALENLIKDKLRYPVKAFISYTNAAVKWYCIKPVKWQPLADNEVWELNMADLYTSDVSFRSKGNTKRERINALYTLIRDIVPAILDVMQLIADAAAMSIEQSLLPLKEELRQKHPPHLAILFSFLKLFRYLQNDLNSFTKKHLDFFYKQVLQLKARDTNPDKAYLVFEIQKQLDKYLLHKGLLVKDGKDTNKAEVFFALDDEIVINKTQIADKRTLFLNNRTFDKTTYLEGVHMTPNADKADGLEQDFKGDELKSFATLGAKNSKYTDPEHNYTKPYPSARLGFILASPVLLLNEGTRTITTTLSCQLNSNICKDLNNGVGTSPSCCDSNENPVLQAANIGGFQGFAVAEDFYERIVTTLNRKYYYINQELIRKAKKKGISAALTDKLNQLLTYSKKICYCEIDIANYECIIPAKGTLAGPGFNDIFNAAEKETLKDFFKPRKALDVLFSGEKEWLEPNKLSEITITPPALPGDNSFMIEIKSVLKADKPAITFYNKDKLKEDFSTTLPLVKIELDDRIKLWHVIAAPQETVCCIEKERKEDGLPVSLYHFFRNVILKDTTISVKVCGLKSIVVQNDESLQDVNGPVYPFGTRPDIIDFNIVNPSKTYCVTQTFINDAISAGVSNAVKTFLENLISSSGKYEVGITEQDLADFLTTPPLNGNKIILEGLFKDPTKNYCELNLIGPSFYIGSREVFCKHWRNVWLNINWKEKPNSFNDYYKAYVLRENGGNKIYGLDEKEFQINLAVLEDGVWQQEQNNTKVNPNSRTNHFNRELFKDEQGSLLPEKCIQQNAVQQVIEITSNFFNVSNTFETCEAITEYKTSTLNGFLKLTLENQDFLHKEYPFVLARQMMALGRLPDVALEGAIYIEHPTNNIITFKGSILLINQILNDIVAIETLSDTVRAEVQSIINRLNNAQAITGPGGSTITSAELDSIVQAIDDIRNSNSAAQLETDIDALLLKITQLQAIFSFFDIDGNVIKPLEVIIPNEPWTPVIKDIALDYTATATLTDIDLIHLYPYEGTYKHEEISLAPALFPLFCDEGTLFLGLQQLVPGSNVNILFQLAEATADSEAERAGITWAYLDNNQWKALRPGFEVLDDATDGLTTSGIVKLALPANMTSDNTILPKGMHWIKAAIHQNSRSVSETIGIHAQAIQVTFTNEEANDKLRLSQPLPAGSIAKLGEADVSIKKVAQPYSSFGGRIPETEGHFYVRVSEMLRHKGRAIQKFDYERLALEGFPQLYKVKCVNHSFALSAHTYANDFPVAPGYVLLAVIPDLNQLKAAQTFEPRVPVSLLEAIQSYLYQRTSPFVRLRIMNPRYEKVHFCLKAKLYLGRDENYYTEKLKQDLREFLAPWAVGQYDKLTFGQCIYRSDVVRFLETRDYLDFILELIYWHETEDQPDKSKAEFEQKQLLPVCPETPRSILIAGDIDVCIQQKDCEAWQQEPPCGHKKILLADYCKKID